LSFIDSSKGRPGDLCTDRERVKAFRNPPRDDGIAFLLGNRRTATGVGARVL